MTTTDTTPGTQTTAATNLYSKEPVIFCAEAAAGRDIPTIGTTPVSTLFAIPTPMSSTARPPGELSTPKSSVKPKRGVEVKSNQKLHYLYTIDPSRPNMWYLTNPTEGWCIPNFTLSELLDVKTDHLLKLGQKYNRGRMHTAAPSSFYLAGNASQRNRRVNKTYMWYSSDILWLLNEHVPTLDEETRDKYAEHRKVLETYPAFSFLVTNTAYEAPPPAATPAVHTPETQSTSSPPAPLDVEAVTDAASESLAEVITDFIQLRAEVLKLREENNILTREKEALNINLSKQLKGAVPHSVTSSQPGFNLEEIDSLNKYLSKSGTHDFVEDLVRAGLLNSTEIYSMGSAVWTDPRTGVLVNKCKFQEILRTVFHTEHSNKRAPSLKAWAMRDNYAAVCQVRCAKVPNKLDAQGQPIDKDNPAYTSNTDPYVRHQVRYTSKAIEYIRNNWMDLIEDYYDRIDEQD